MVDEKLRQKICEETEGEAVVFDKPAFDKAIVGISHDDRVIYDYEKMVKEFASDNSVSEEEAEEFIMVNILRALPDMGEHRPIILVEKI